MFLDPNLPLKLINSLGNIPSGGKALREPIKILYNDNIISTSITYQQTYKTPLSKDLCASVSAIYGNLYAQNFTMDAFFTSHLKLL